MRALKRIAAVLLDLVVDDWSVVGATLLALLLVDLGVNLLGGGAVWGAVLFLAIAAVLAVAHLRDARS